MSQAVEGKAVQMKGEYKVGTIGGFNRKGHAPNIGKNLFG
jgi:hypothetical protein